MPKTITEISDYINEMLPNRVNSTTLVTFIDDEFKLIRHFTPDYNVWSTETAANTQNYTLPNNIKADDVISFHVSGTTYNAAAVVTSTLDWNKYDFVGYEDRHKGGSYFKASTGTANYADIICLNPIPTDITYLKALYWDYPQTSNGSTTIISNDYVVAYLTNKVLSKVARVGNHPRIDLSNNYEIEAGDILNDLKREREKVVARLSPTRKGYKDWW